MIYPIETLPLSSLLAGSVGSFVSFLIFLVLSIITGSVRWTFLLLPIPVALLVLFVLGVSWVFMIAGVLVKDLREIVFVILGLTVYVSPVIIQESTVSPALWRLITLNPLAHVVICFRDVYNAQFHGMSWTVFTAMTVISFVVGGWVITKAKIKINEYI